MATVQIGDRLIGEHHPTYFIADISANHDGDLDRAKLLIQLAAESGADAAKFQNFRAEKIVSARGFADLGAQLSHQSNWKKSVVEVYEEASLPWEWTETLAEECARAGIHYFSSPYDVAAVDMLDAYVPAFKIGSGDITFSEILRHMASKQKPILLATGASTMEDVERAMRDLGAHRAGTILMQCNTNYTGSHENLQYINLRVLETYRLFYPDVVLGLSDHTANHATVLGAVALGARAVEKHFTDDPTRDGPDHPFSMIPASWREMVDRTRELEAALGHPSKDVEDNERETVIIQRRGLRAVRRLEAGHTLAAADLEALRPCPPDAVEPFHHELVTGRVLNRGLDQGQHLSWSAIDPA